jgi:hypothetical protein
MVDLPLISPRFAPQPDGVTWPTDQWPRSTSAHQSEIDRVVDELFTQDDLAVTNAVVVVQGGHVIGERYGGVKEYFDRPAEPITATSSLLSWSMAKSVLHMIIGTLVDDGRLDPDQRAPVPEWSDPTDPRHQIQLRDLLAMRDGLDFVEEYEIGRESNVLEMLWGDGKTNMAAYTANRPLAHEPGSRFHYSSGTTNILSRIVADHVGYADAYDATTCTSDSSPQLACAAPSRVSTIVVSLSHRASCTPTRWTSPSSDCCTTWRRVGRPAADLARVGRHRAARSARRGGRLLLFVAVVGHGRRVRHVLGERLRGPTHHCRTRARRGHRALRTHAQRALSALNAWRNGMLDVLATSYTPS